MGFNQVMEPAMNLRPPGFGGEKKFKAKQIEGVHGRFFGVVA